MAKTKKPPPQGIKSIAENRKARRNYDVGETFEAGLSLLGTEVKSLRAGHVHFKDSYVDVRRGELFLVGMTIDPFEYGTHENHEPDRMRKLLLHRREMERLITAIDRSGLTVVPLKLYFKKGWAKVLIGLARGRSTVDKREQIKKRQADRDMAREIVRR